MSHISCLLWSITLIGVIFSLGLAPNSCLALELWRSGDDDAARDDNAESFAARVLETKALLPCGRYYFFGENDSLKVNSEEYEFRGNACTWEFAATGNCKLQLSFTDISFNNADCSKEYIVISDGYSSNRLCKSTNTPLVYKATTGKLKLTYDAEERPRGKFELTASCELNA